MYRIVLLLITMLFPSFMLSMQGQKRHSIFITVYEGLVDDDDEKPVYGYGSVYCNGAKQIHGREKQRFYVNEGDSAIIKILPDQGHIINTVNIIKIKDEQQKEEINDKIFEPNKEINYRFTDIDYDMNIIVSFIDYNYYYLDIDHDILSYHIYPASQTAELSRAKYYSIAEDNNNAYTINTDNLVIPDTIIYNEHPFTVTTIGNMGLFRSKISNLEIPSTIKRIKRDAFYQCNGMNKLVIPPSITQIDKYAFRQCSIDSVVFQEQSDSLSIGKALFAAYDARTRVKYVELPKDLQILPDQMFFNCEIESINLPTSVKAIGRQTFEYSNIKRIIIPEGVTELQYQTFYCCKKLKSITIPKSLNYIGQQVFGETELDTIHCLGIEPPFIEVNAFSSNSGPEKRYPLLIVPNGTKEAYQNAMIWKECQILEESEMTDILPINKDQDNPYYYSINGQKMERPKKGINIIRQRDGKSKKIIITSK